ncbi:MAG TPA: histidine phosphatase family protein [Gammaproteobacteria bacterium]|nr:histidine phosphatase family protein [Gammaproteobacteria bacterium]
MKRILLLRHAKARPGDADTLDADRPLDPRGEAAATAVGGYLARAGWLPDAVLCSAARRARETLEGLWRDWPHQPPAVYEEALYAAGPADLLARLQEADPETETVLVVGHNHTIQQAALDLAGGGNTAAYAQMKARFPTAGLALLEADVADWSELHPGGADLRAFVGPEDVPPAPD